MLFSNLKKRKKPCLILEIKHISLQNLYERGLNLYLVSIRLQIKDTETSLIPQKEMVHKKIVKVYNI